MFNKKGIISLNLFVLLLFLFIIILGFSYFYKGYIQSEHNYDIVYSEVVNSGLSLRSFFVELIIFENETMTYFFEYDDPEITIFLNDSSILVSKEFENELIEKEFNLYGISFCSSSYISPLNRNNFTFNGTCILQG